MRTHLPRCSMATTFFAVMAIGVAACGGSSSSGGSGGASSSGGTMNIGVIYPYTGPNADQGAVGMAGCLAGIGPVNAAGGVLGKKFACKPFDTKGDPADAVPAATQMMASASPVMVLGASDDAVATAPIVTGSRVPNFATVGDPHFDHQTNEYFYRLTPSDALQGVALGYYAAAHNLKHSAAAFTSDLGAQTSVPPLRTEYKRLGGTLVSDVKLAPGQSSYRTEVQKIIASHPDALLSEMDPQSSTTFLSEYSQLGGGLPLVIGTQRTSNSDWIQAVIKGIGAKAFAKIKAITPYVALSGPAYEKYKSTLLGLGSKVKDPSQYAGHPYSISDYDAVNITALAMLEAKSTEPAKYNPFITKVTAAAPGATVVHTFDEGAGALKSAKTIQYVGASGPLAFDKYHSAARAFAYDSYDPATKAMKVTKVIPGSALSGG
jgi:ABC-type branched-subunit amino acid transport system substrate-binding protein